MTKKKPEEIKKKKFDSDSLPLVMVEWTDAVLDSRWSSDIQADKIEPERCLTVGWLIQKTKKFIKIAGTISPEGDENFTGIFVIPTTFRPTITRLQVMEEKK